MDYIGRPMLLSLWKSFQNIMGKCTCPPNSCPDVGMILVLDNNKFYAQFGYGGSGSNNTVMGL
ncbi:MAG: hypothetical protein CR994_05525 [Maribacter sp.]|nr:MAG: hypothetical protein CR994_05525 [Maribacter sp.]